MADIDAATPRPGEERYFAMFDIEEAVAWARAGGIAVHQNFEVDGLKIGGKVRQGRAYHVFGQKGVLLAWGKRNGQRPAWIQDRRETRGLFAGIPHFDVFGEPARRLERRLGIPLADVAGVEAGSRQDLMQNVSESPGPDPGS